MTGRATVAAILALAGGVAVSIGSFLTWAEISAGPYAEQARGIDGWEGKATLVAGVVLVVAALRALSGRDPRARRLRLRAAFAGVVAVGIGVYTAVTAERQLLDIAAMELSRAGAELALASGMLELSLGAGLVIVIAGGAQGLLAALVMSGSGGAPPPRRSGLTGWSTLPREDQAR